LNKLITIKPGPSAYRCLLVIIVLLLSPFAVASCTGDAPARVKTAVQKVDVATGNVAPRGFEDAASLSLEALIDATRHQGWKVRWDAVNELGVRGDARGTAALAERALRDENPHPRWRSLWALSSIDPDAGEAIPLFLVALEDSDPIVVRNAAVAVALDIIGDASTTK